MREADAVANPGGTRLAHFAGAFPRKAPTARSLAALIENPGCTARRVLDAASIDKHVLAARVGRAVPEGESIFALNRGTRFESQLKADGYRALVQLLRDQGFAAEAVTVLPLRDLYPLRGTHAAGALARRAEATRGAVLAMAAGQADAPNLIDGGALHWDFGGAVARLETDGIAWRLGGRIHVVEIKSFPIVDGRGAPEKIGAAAWQAAVYVAAITDLLLAGGLDASRVASEVLLVCPRNTGLVPLLVRLDVARQVRALRRLLAGRARVPDVLARLGPALTLETSGLDAEATAQHLAEVLARLGTNYLPACLSACPLAFHCRDQARASGDPSLLGADARASLGGVRSLPRALALAAGAAPTAGEADAAATAVRAHRLLQEARAPA